jgi:hypothetical protein
LGNKEEALKWGKKATELNPIQSDPWGSGEEILLDLVQIYVLCGEYDEALDALETLLTIPGLVTRWRVRLNPSFDPLRDHPRFKRLVGEEGD